MEQISSEMGAICRLRLCELRSLRWRDQLERGLSGRNSGLEHFYLGKDSTVQVRSSPFCRLLSNWISTSCARRRQSCPLVSEINPVDQNDLREIIPACSSTRFPSLPVYPASLKAWATFISCPIFFKALELIDISPTFGVVYCYKFAV